MGFRLWRPKREGLASYRTQRELAQDLVSGILRIGLPFEYLVFDLWYKRPVVHAVAGSPADLLGEYPQGQRLDHLPWPHPSGRGVGQAASPPPDRRQHLCLDRHRVSPRYGTIRLVVATNGQGGLDDIVSNDRHRRGKTLLDRKRSRWDIETCFRDTKQLAGLGACQCRVPQAMERHVALVLLAFVVLQQARLDPSETVGEVKRRLQLAVIQKDGATSETSMAPFGKGELVRAA